MPQIKADRTPQKEKRGSSGRVKVASDMASARINLKNIDYFKFKKLVIDANRDDYNACAREVRALCDDVQTLRFRDEEFDDETDRGRFAQICTYYKQILLSKRIDPTDVRIKSGWWGDHKNAYSAGKLKPAILKDILLSKAKDWATRHGDTQKNIDKLSSRLDGPGLYVFKHKDHQCFQYVGKAERIFARCGELLKQAYEGSSQEPLGALLIISVVTDWEFYIIPVGSEDDDNVLRILENDLILKHDSIWPHGLNFRLHIDSLLEVSEFRKSCLRHHWPPNADPVSEKLDMCHLREQVKESASDEPIPAPVEIKPAPKKSPKPKPDWVGVNEENKENTETKEKSGGGKMIYIPFDTEDEVAQPDDDAVSVSSTGTYTKEEPDLTDASQDVTSDKSSSKGVVRRGSYTVASPVVKKRESLQEGGSSSGPNSPRPPRTPASTDGKSSRPRKQGTPITRPVSCGEPKTSKTTPNGTPKKSNIRKSAIRSSAGSSISDLSGKGRQSRGSSDGESTGDPAGMVSSTDTMELSTSSLSDEAVKSEGAEDTKVTGPAKLKPERSRLPVAPSSPRR